jgi:hypothetical protein
VEGALGGEVMGFSLARWVLGFGGIERLLRQQRDQAMRDAVELWDDPGVDIDDLDNPRHDELDARIAAYRKTLGIE